MKLHTFIATQYLSIDHKKLVKNYQKIAEDSFALGPEQLVCIALAASTQNAALESAQATNSLQLNSSGGRRSLRSQRAGNAIVHAPRLGWRDAGKRFIRPLAFPSVL